MFAFIIYIFICIIYYRLPDIIGIIKFCYSQILKFSQFNFTFFVEFSYSTFFEFQTFKSLSVLYILSQYCSVTSMITTLNLPVMRIMKYSQRPNILSKFLIFLNYLSNDCIALEVLMSILQLGENSCQPRECIQRQHE